MPINADETWRRKRIRSLLSFHWLQYKCTTNSSVRFWDNMWLAKTGNRLLPVNPFHLQRQHPVSLPAIQGFFVSNAGICQVGHRYKDITLPKPLPHQIETEKPLGEMERGGAFHGNQRFPKSNSGKPRNLWLFISFVNSTQSLLFPVCWFFLFSFLWSLRFLSWFSMDPICFLACTWMVCYSLLITMCLFFSALNPSFLERCLCRSLQQIHCMSRWIWSVLFHVKFYGPDLH